LGAKSREFPGDGASNDREVIEKVDFQCLRTLRLRNVRKWGQYYHVVLLQAVSIACYAEPCISYDRVVRQSVRPSVCHTLALSQNDASLITKSSPTDSPSSLVLAVKSSSRNSKGVTPSDGVKREWDRKNSQFSANNSLYLSNGARQDKSYY